MAENETARRWGEPMSVLKEVSRYVICRYGNLISADEPLFDYKTKTWIVQLKTDYPRIIQDDRSDERTVKFLSMKGLGTLRFSEDLKPIESASTKKEECVEKLKSFLEIWQERAERIVIMASSDQLARISETQWVLAPIREIISNLLQKDCIYDGEIKVKGEKIGQYLKLLEDLELIQKVESGYTYGNLFTALREKTPNQNSQEFKMTVLSHIIRERYPMLVEVFGITQLIPFIHVESAYYQPTLEAEKLLYRKRESIITNCAQVYGYKDSLRINYILDELVGVGALERRNRCYYGNEEMFSKMLEMKGELSDLSPPTAH
jgi:hypothetical protein